MEMAGRSQNGLKTLCEKEKLLAKSNFSLSQSVSKRLVLKTHKTRVLFGKGLISERRKSLFDLRLTLSDYVLS